MSTALLLALSCTCGQPATGPSPASEVKPSEHRVERLDFNFRGATADAMLPPEAAFAHRERCPRITTARYRPGNEKMGTLQLWGDGLDRVAKLAAHDGTGAIGEAPPHPEADGSVRFALGCQSCSVVLGIEVDGLMVGCVGPGHSLQLVGGRLVDG